MTIKELKEAIKDLPGDMEVMVTNPDWGTEEAYAEIRNITRINYEKNSPHGESETKQYLVFS